MCVSPVWGSPSDDTRRSFPPPWSAPCRNADGSALRERLARGEQPKVTLHAEVDTGWRQTPILEAEIDGPDPDGPFILFSGHHDTWYYGVMDNGAANATMLEVARVAAGQRGAWRRGLRLCFWSGHSHGRYSGSTWYADQHWDELERRCAVHVNVDSTGGVGAVVLRNAAAAPELVALAGEAIGEQAGSDYAGKRMSRSSDQSFWGIGIPAMFGALSEQPPAAGEDAQCARLVVAYAARPARQDRPGQPGARHARLRAHAVAAADRSGPAARLRRACRRAARRTRRAGCLARGTLSDRRAGCRGRDAAHGGGGRRAFRRGADARLPRPGTGILHERRPFRARSGAAAAGMAGARSAAPAGETGRRQRTARIS